MKKKSMFCFAAFLLAACLSAGCQTENKKEAASATASAATEAAAEETSEAAEALDDTAENADAQSASGDRHTFPIERLSRSEEIPMGDGDKWTIFMYVCGSDLESVYGAASLNLLDIMDAVPGDGINIVVQTGGSSQWGQEDMPFLEDLPPEEILTADINPDMLQRYVLTDTMTLVDEQPLASMGSGDTFYDFLSWGVENYPAEKMGVILWNHGGASIAGVCQDELFDDMLLPFEMEEALEKLYPEMTDRFEFIGFDACLMGTIEIANILVPHARYMYGSEETEPGYGWYYSELVNELNRNPDVDGASLGEVVSDSYFMLCQAADQHYSATFSVTDLEKVDEILYALDDLALDLNEGIEDPDWLGSVTRSVYRAESYSYNFCIDLGDMADQLSGLMPEKARRLKEALEEAVVYSIHGPARMFASGLSVYYPVEMSAGAFQRYKLCAPTPAYADYIGRLEEQYLKTQLSGKQPVAILEEPALGEDGRYEMTIDPDSMGYVAEMGFGLYYVPEDEDSCLLLGYDSDVYADLESGQVSDVFEGGWFMLDGQTLTVFLEDYNDEYSIYSSPILLNGEQTNLKIQWVWDETQDAGGYANILGTYMDSDPDTETASRMMRPLQPGDVVTPRYFFFSLESVTADEEIDPDEEVLPAEGGDITITEDSEITFSLLDPGIYLYQFSVTDVYGTEQTYVPAVFELEEDGQVIRSMPEEIQEEQNSEDISQADAA